jgi:uncharacterized protein YaaQ
MAPDFSTTFMLAIVQAEDLDDAMHELEQCCLFTAHLPSAGGFLGRRNATLLISAQPGQVSGILDALRRTCKQRTQYMSSTIETSATSIPMPIPVTVGGAIVFFIPMEHFEEF